MQNIKTKAGGMGFLTYFLIPYRKVAFSNNKFRNGLHIFSFHNVIAIGLLKNFF